MIYTYLVFQFALFLLSLGGYFQVKKFLGSHADISQSEDLAAFKALVKVNMYVALIYLVLGIPAVMMSIYLGYTYGLLGVFAVLAVNVPHLLFGKNLRSLEQKARSLNCSPFFEPEYRAVSHTWFKKALPDF